MRHSRYEDLILLSVYDELNSTQQSELEDHVAHCEVCRKELQEMKNLQGLFDTCAGEPSDALLAEARAQLHGALSAEPQRKRPRRYWKEDLLAWVSLYRAPLASVASLAAGMALGSLFFAGQSAISTSTFPPEDADLSITNVRFVDSDLSDGAVELAYDLVRPVYVSGRITDTRIQKTLAQALLTSRNPGVRLRAVGAMVEQSRRGFDPDVRLALTFSMVHDENAGVRKRALELLSGAPLTEGFREALIQVLLNDENAGMRVAAINALEGISFRDWTPSRHTVDELQRLVEEEKNDFVRLRSKAFLQEVQYK